MINPLHLQLAKTLLGRDYTPEAEMFFKTRATIGQALDQKGQEFFMQNWRNLPDFLSTPAGQEIIQLTIGMWQDAMRAATEAATAKLKESTMAQTARPPEANAAPTPMTP